jgi:hypothetical protein
MSHDLGMARYADMVWGKSSSEIFAFALIIFVCVGGAQAATTQVHIIKYASDGTTVLNETTVDYLWLESHLPVHGDGVTHYYHQGPVFESEWAAIHPGEPYDMWDPEETVNYQDKDTGAVKGSDIRDICDLVGGMSEGDLVKIISSDGFFKTFPYENVYYPEPRQGYIILSWYREEEGYVPDYYEGMRIVFLADASTNPDGLHVFGVWDMHETIPEEFWHYFYGGSTLYPTTTGYTVKSVDRVEILGNDPPTGSLTVTSLPANAIIYLDGNEVGHTNTTLHGLEPGEYEVRIQLENFEDPAPRNVEISPGITSSVHFNLAPCTGNISVLSSPSGARIYLDGDDTSLVTDAILENVQAGAHAITVKKSGYHDSSQSVNVIEGEIANVSFSLIPAESGGGETGSYSTGFSGNVLSLSVTDAFHGSISSVIAKPQTTILTGGSTLPISFKVVLPAQAVVRTGRLYAYTWNEFESFLSARDPDIEVEFQGITVVPDHTYTDTLHEGSSETRVHTFCYDIGGLLDGNGTYSVLLKNTGVLENTYGIRGAALVIAYEEDSLPLLRWWLFEGCDAIEGEPYSSAVSTGAAIERTLDPGKIDEAELSIISTGVSGTMANHRFLLNDLVSDRHFSKTASQIERLSFTLSPDYLLRSENRIEIESYASSATPGDYLENRNMILVFTYLHGEDEGFTGNGSAVHQEHIVEEFQFAIPSEFSQPLIYGTGNGELSLRIKEKTNIKNDDGSPVEVLTVQKINETRAFPDMELIWLYYISPENATADGSIRLSISLDEVAFNKTAKKAVLIRYNPLNGRWDEISGSFSAEDARITSEIDRLGLYGVVIEGVTGNETLSQKETESTPLPIFLALCALILYCFVQKWRR